MGFGSSLASRITGNINKALLMVDVYVGEVEEPSTAPPSRLEMTASQVRKVKKMAKVMETIASKGLEDLATTPEGTQRYYFYVQYNPSDLSVNGEKSVVAVPDLEKRTADGQAVVQIEAASSSLEFKLYFDEVSIAAAFLHETIGGAGGLNVTSVAKGLAGTVSKTKSVRKYVDALVACVGNNRVKQISLYWASFAFIGKLSRITADYTMFDTSGNPIRAEVAIVMEQLESADNWSDSIDKSFKKAASMNAVGNLLNLNL